MVTKTLGGLAAMVALAAGILANLDPMLVLERAGVAGLAGCVVGALIAALVNISGPISTEAATEQSGAPVASADRH